MKRLCGTVASDVIIFCVSKKSVATLLEKHVLVSKQFSEMTRVQVFNITLEACSHS